MGPPTPPPIFGPFGVIFFFLKINRVKYPIKKIARVNKGEAFKP